jgi:hypothetical protein
MNTWLFHTSCVTCKLALHLPIQPPDCLPWEREKREKEKSKLSGWSYGSVTKHEQHWSKLE